MFWALFTIVSLSKWFELTNNLIYEKKKFLSSKKLLKNLFVLIKRIKLNYFFVTWRV